MKVLIFLISIGLSVQSFGKMKDTNIIIDSKHYEGEATFDKSGAMNGPFVAYTQHSQLNGVMKNGEPHGKVIETGTDGMGKPIKTLTNFENGLVTGPYESWRDAKLIEKGSYKNGEPVGEWQVTENGRLVSKSYSIKKSKPQRTAQQKKNDEYIQKLTNAAVANSRYKAQQAEKRLQEIQRCVANAGSDVQKYLECQK